jgi:serine protease inhibitor
MIDFFDPANRMFLNTSCPVRKAYKDLLNKSFGAAYESINFMESENARIAINTWVANQTNKKILNLLEKGKVTKETISVIVNTLYFNAKWLHPMILLQNQTFYVAENKTVRTDMMMLNGALKYTSNYLQSQIIELEFLSTNMTMIVIVPNDRVGLKEVEGNFSSLDLRELRKSMKRAMVGVQMPKFKIEFGIELQNTLKLVSHLLDIVKILTNYSHSRWASKAFLTLAVATIQCLASKRSKTSNLHRSFRKFLSTWTKMELKPQRRLPPVGTLFNY